MVSLVNGMVPMNNGCHGVVNVYVSDRDLCYEAVTANKNLYLSFVKDKQDYYEEMRENGENPQLRSTTSKGHQRSDTKCFHIYNKKHLGL